MDKVGMGFLLLGIYLIIALSIYMKGLIPVAKTILTVAAALMLFIAALRIVAIIIMVIVGIIVLLTNRWSYW